MLPITDGITLPNRDCLRVKDDYLQQAIDGCAYLVFDGAMGTMLQRRNLKAGELPELLCLSQPDEITAIHREYVEAGSQVVTTNTFGANARKLDGAARVDEVFAAAIACADRLGSLDAGKQADLVIWDAPDLNYLCYRLGSNLTHTVIKKGEIVHAPSH